MDLTQICRICLDARKQMLDIYTHPDLKLNIAYSEMLSNCTRLQPCEDDGLPRLICKECSRQLKRSYSFNLQCEESDKSLRSFLDNNTDLLHINHLSAVKKEENRIKLEIEDIKFESQYGNDQDYWEPDDDDTILINLKSKDNLGVDDVKPLLQPELQNVEELVLDNDNYVTKAEKSAKKRRGRKRKVHLDVDPPSKLPHQCDICGKFFSNKSNMKMHMISHTDLRPYKCTECPSDFKGYSALYQHRKIHTGVTPYHCEYCSKQFSRRTCLVNHIRRHTGEKMYSCDICFKTFVQSAQLSTHMKRHKGDKTFLCQTCGKGFPIKADLQVHQRIHNGEKPYSCHLCSKTFTTSGNLSIHVRIHNKEIRYKCKDCGRGFVTCSSYNVHLKRHKGQRDHHCECGKTFYTSSALKQHRVVHTGEKRYQCKICDRKFSQTSHLSRHFKRDHSTLPLEQYKLMDKVSTDFTLSVPPDKIDNAVKCEG